MAAVVSASPTLVINKRTTPYVTSLSANLFQGDGCTVEKVDLSDVYANAPSLKDNYLVVFDNVLSPLQCNKLIAAAELTNGGTWDGCTEREDGINVNRKCQRIMWDSPQMVARLWERIRDLVPELHIRREDFNVNGKSEQRMTRLNERLRFLKYEAGEYFHAHPDCYYETEDGTERSYITILLFLSGQVPSDKDDVRGGALTFHSKDMKESFQIQPKAGRLLLFEQEHLLHSGEPVQSGIKYAVRSDVMYEV